MLSITVFSPCLLKSLYVLINVVSSGYKIDLNMSHAFDMSVVYLINNKGLGIKRWGTPMVMFAREDLTSLNSTNFLRSDRFYNFLVALDRCL